MSKLVLNVLGAAGLAYVVATAAARLDTPGAPSPSPVPTANAGASTATARTGPATTVIAADRNGHFVAQASIEGMFVTALVDTGASMVAMSAEDAQRAGVRPEQGAPKRSASTANGRVEYSVARIREIRLNGIVVRDVEAAIMPKGALQGTLLGMTFLRQLSKVELGGGRLLLVQ